jgi:hypothetical protein
LNLFGEETGIAIQESNELLGIAFQAVEGFVGQLISKRRKRLTRVGI